MSTQKTASPSKAVQAFIPKRGLSRLERGKEFLYLQNLGRDVEQIIAIYKKNGIHLAVPTVYNALRIAEAPSFVRGAIQRGEVNASEVLKLLKPLRNKKGKNKGKKVAETDRAYAERIKGELDELITLKQERSTKLKKAGFESENGGELKLTRMRTVKLVRKSLDKVLRGSDALKSAKAKAINEFLKGLEEGLTEDELLKLALAK